MDAFKKEITFLSKTLSGEGVWIDEEITKTATFKELNRVDRSQHKLHFKMMTVFEGFGVDEEGRFKLDSDALYDLTVKAIKLLITIDAEFTETDKTEFLNDSGAILSFGTWVFKEKFTPFFLKFKM